jgi:hypothetical protein
MVTADGGCGPFETGSNITFNLHFFFGSSCVGQFVAPVKICGLVVGSVKLAKVIGGPFLAELPSVNVKVFV